MKTVDSFNIQIWLGLREGYTEKKHDINDVYDVVYKVCQYPGNCLTVTPTRFIYKGGWEDGVVIGIINYARYPIGKMNHKYNALEIAERLKAHFKQQRVSITTPEKTYLIGED